MNGSPARAAAVTGALMLAGALLGAISATVGALIAVSITHGIGEAFSWTVLGGAAVMGGVLGAPLLPAASWLLMRRVPLGAAFLGTAVAATLGGVIGWVAAWLMSGNPVVWPVAAAIACFLLAVLLLRRRFAASPETRVRVAAG